MTLEGFQTASWLGWFTGVYFVKKPWGIPEPTGWCHLHNLFSVLLWLIGSFLWADFQKRTSHLFTELSATNYILCKSVHAAFVAFDLYFRVVLLIKKGKIPNFLARLERNEFNCCSIQNSGNKRCRNFHTRVQWLLLIPRLACPLIIIMWYSQAANEHGWFIIRPPWYFVVFFFLAELPSMFSIIYVYDLIVTSTFELLQAIEDFFASVDDIMMHRKLRGSVSDFGDQSIINMVTAKDVKFNEEDTYEQYEDRRTSVFSQNMINSRMDTCAVTKAILEKFESLKALSRDYDDVNGYLILGVLVRAVFMIIHSIASLIVTPNKNYVPEIAMKLSFDIVILIVEVSQLMLLYLGSEVKETVCQWKERIKKRVVLMEDEQEKVQMRELAGFLGDWNWSMTAAELFCIEKGTLCGILTTTLSYVVIVCQLSGADVSPSCGNDTLLWDAENLTDFTNLH